MTLTKSKILRIGIVGAGFSGVSLTANLHRLMEQQQNLAFEGSFERQAVRKLEIFLFEKTSDFALGDAYRTPFVYHLLNVRALNMSVFDDLPNHFVNWLDNHQKTLNQEAIQNFLDPAKPIADQFVPRLWYGHYLKHVLKTIGHNEEGFQLNLIKEQVIDVIPNGQHSTVILKSNQSIALDKIVFAMGNLAPAQFPFPILNMKTIENPWDYLAPKQIKSDESVFIVGTGLSMIDVVLTLHHQKHQGKIYALSRHGLIPLPHGDDEPAHYELSADFANDLRTLTKQLRLNIKNHHKLGGDWRSVINAYRAEIPKLWPQISLRDKEKFLRHVLPYWNIHRHRVHNKIGNLLTTKVNDQQLCLMDGRVLNAKNNIVTIQMRTTHEIKQIKADWLINCMGPSLNATLNQDPLIASLLKRGIVTIDALKLGFLTDQQGALQTHTGQLSTHFYALGPITKGMFWESTAVPGIRKQSLSLATHLFFD